MTDLSIEVEYASFLSELKMKIRSAQTRAMMSVNAELVQLYWQLGHDLLERQKTSKWGDKMLVRLCGRPQIRVSRTKGFFN
jgi:DUF1016 N-terminal domain